MGATGAQLARELDRHFKDLQFAVFPYIVGRLHAGGHQLQLPEGIRSKAPRALQQGTYAMSAVASHRNLDREVRERSDECGRASVPSVLDCAELAAKPRV